MMASSFYESGFDHLNAFRSGFEQAGGELLRLQVTDTPGQPSRLAAFLQDVDRLRPDWVAAFYSGDEACHFFLLWQRLGLAGRVPLVGPAFLVEERLLDRHGAAAADVRSALSWAPSLGGPENLEFVRAYRAAERHVPDSLALLGYEAAGILTQAASRVGRGSLSPSALAEALRSVDYRGPRGECRLDGGTPSGHRPVYLRQVAGGGRSLHNSILEELPPVTPSRLAATGEGPRTGWLNPYLCL
jgi:branched-chain amino acid transport system substrate-binding protein